jgi:naringenin degradation protein FdeJ
MHVAITGASGYVGRALARQLQADAQLGGRAIERMTLLDLAFEDAPVASFVRRRAGDLTDAASLQAALAGAPLDVLFHLASIPGGTAERDYALARAVNLDATLTLLECCKTQVEAGSAAPVFVFASSIAVFGEMPSRVDDATPTRPRMSYGAHKLVGEILVDDFSRRGWIDGRSLRLPGVLARPPARTGQMSAFLSDMIRELAAGRTFVCPMSAGATTWASSLPCVVANLLHGATVPDTRLEGRRTFTLPTLRFSMGELADAIAVVYGVDAPALLRWAPDARIEALFGCFPPLVTPCAEAAGFRSDGDTAALVKAALAPG